MSIMHSPYGMIGSYEIGVCFCIGVMFTGDLVFGLFKRIASNKREEKRFLHQAIFMVFYSFTQREQNSI